MSKHLNFNPSSIKKLFEAHGFGFLYHLVEKVADENPFKSRFESAMWNEQCFINFPILYLSSFYLYFYAKARKCKKFLFVTRDCCHWVKIFQILFPHEKSCYFHASRNIFEKAHAPYYDKYVDSIIGNDIDSTIIIDIYGTGRTAYQYFKRRYDRVPEYFLISSKLSTFKEPIYDPDRITTITKTMRASPIEMLNYDLVGTLQDFTRDGPVRDKLEYDYNVVNVYHKAIGKFLTKISPIKNTDSRYTRTNLSQVINGLCRYIKDSKPIVAQRAAYIGNHKKMETPLALPDFKVVDLLCGKSYGHGLIWNVLYNDNPSVLKVVVIGSDAKSVKLKTPKSHSKNPFDIKNFGTKPPMTFQSFNQEVANLKQLSEVGWAPSVYKADVYKNFGYILMEKADASMKDVLLKRDLTQKEVDIVGNKISEFHKEFVHSDLKPSNIGVYFDSKNNIKSCIFLDCQKIQPATKKLIARDWTNFKNHIQRNINKRKSM